MERPIFRQGLGSSLDLRRAGKLRYDPSTKGQVRKNSNARGSLLGCATKKPKHHRMRWGETSLDTYSLSEESICLVFIGLLAMGTLSSTASNTLFQGPADERFTCVPPTVLCKDIA